jgi:hypothetical protein
VIAERDFLAHPAALVPECRLTAYVSNAVHHSCGTGAEEKLLKRVACNRKTVSQASNRTNFVCDRARSPRVRNESRSEDMVEYPDNPWVD